MAHRERLAIPQSDHRAAAGFCLMDRQSWHRVKQVLESTLTQPPEERASYVVRICGDDGVLRTEVESLLTAINEADNFITPSSQSLSLSAAFPAGWIPDL